MNEVEKIFYMWERNNKARDMMCIDERDNTYSDPYLTKVTRQLYDGWYLIEEGMTEYNSQATCYGRIMLSNTVSQTEQLLFWKIHNHKKKKEVMREIILPNKGWEYSHSERLAVARLMLRADWRFAMPKRLPKWLADKNENGYPLVTLQEAKVEIMARIKGDTVDTNDILWGLEVEFNDTEYTDEKPSLRETTVSLISTDINELCKLLQVGLSTWILNKEKQLRKAINLSAKRYDGIYPIGTEGLNKYFMHKE